MKRQIKFRAKRTDTGEWVFGDLIHGVGSKHGRMYILPVTHIYPKGCDNLDGWEVTPDSVGQFTGLLDKKGKEVYEGDILQNTPRELQYKVYWSKDMHAWFVERIDYGSKEPLCCLGDNFEVLGSVHDNPELLEGGKE